jgi:2'-5' RNA ligase
VGAARVPEAAGGFTPHVSLAYSDTDGPDEPFAAALGAMAPRSATVEFAAIQAISLGRDGHLYRWQTVAMVPLGLHVDI